MKTYLYSIAYCCPKKERGKDCPLLEIEHLSFEEKIVWVDKLEEKKEVTIVRHHMHCTMNKN